MIRQLLVSLLIQIALVAARGKGGHHLPANGPPPGKKWSTLNGGEPVVVARGGFSGIAPDSSNPAVILAKMTSLASTMLLCDLQFTKDSQAFCQSDLNLQNSTTIATDFQNLKPKTYKINGNDTLGWFGVDFSWDELSKISLMQSVFTRSPSFDGSYRLQSPYDIATSQETLNLWLNVEYPGFYDGLNINPAIYISATMQDLAASYISSPEVAFLKGLSTMLGKTTTKFVLKIPNLAAIEPTTKTPYSTLLSDINTIKTYASGIILPKDSIWPVDNARILQPATSLVSDFHKAGLEVFASGFANDNYLMSYNYSYDPAREYLQFVDNSQFSVDGVITDFPATGSAAIGCLAHNQNASRIVKALIITHDGASGDYPGSSDVAFQKAIDDGADIIDCSVQMSKDGIAFCSPSVDLTGTTTAASSFMDRSTKIPEIQNKDGIFSFDLTWSEIQSVKPQIANVYDGPLVRNPANNNAGKFVSLADFLDLAKTRAVPGVLINIKNAAYLASNKGLDIVGVVTTALSNATFDKQSTQKVLIQSDDSSVLLKFQDVNTYQKVLLINKDISGATEQTAQEIKKYANAVRVFRNSIVLNYPNPLFMSKSLSNLLEVMHTQNISVYVGVLRNEFQNFLFDYFADPYVELATLTQTGVDGIVTDFPATASAYMKSPCSDPNTKLNFTIMPICPGDMHDNLVIAKPPLPALTSILLQPTDIVDPPLRPVTKITDPTTTPGSLSSSNPSSPASGSKSSSTTTSSNTMVTIAAMIGVLTILGCNIKYYL